MVKYYFAIRGRKQILRNKGEISIFICEISHSPVRAKFNQRWAKLMKGGQRHRTATKYCLQKVIWLIWQVSYTNTDICLTTIKKKVKIPKTKLKSPQSWYSTNINEPIHLSNQYRSTWGCTYFIFNSLFPIVSHALFGV